MVLVVTRDRLVEAGAGTRAENRRWDRLEDPVKRVSRSAQRLWSSCTRPVVLDFLLCECRACGFV